MTKNRAKKRTAVYMIDYGDFEAMVLEEWPIWKGTKLNQYDSWSFPASEECGNDVAKTYTVERDESDDVDRDEVNAFEEKAKRSGMWVSGALLNEMCRRGIIEPGEYIIEVSW